MAEPLPAALSVASPGGELQVLLCEGTPLPARGRAVFATQRAGERQLALELLEGEGQGARHIGYARCELPPGLPANTWLAVFVSVAADRTIAVEVAENLRRLRLEADLDRSAAESRHL